MLSLLIVDELGYLPLEPDAAHLFFQLERWRELLVDIKARSLAVPPEIAVGDGALGFWKALDGTWPSTRHQRCWVHKTSNVLNKVPKSIQPTVKSDLRDIWQAETRADAGAAMGVFAEKYGRKYEKAVTCLTKDREALLASTTSPRSTGTTCEPPTRSRASSPRSGIAPSGPRARCRRRQRG